MKVGDLVVHRDKLWMENPRLGIVTEIHIRRTEPSTFVDVLWSDKGHTILGYMPNELRSANESW